MKYLDQAFEAARAAGTAIMNYYRTDLTVSHRAGEPVTAADKAAEKEIYIRLKKSTGIGYFSEEAGASIPSNENFWVVDPLDGTSDFLRKNGEFAVMIALVQINQPVFGLIYQPQSQNYYYAIKGEGSFLVTGKRRRKIRVSNQKNLARAKVYISRSHLLDTDKFLLEKLKVSLVIPMGSGLKSCQVASGQGDIYFNTSSKTGKWDVCAADIIISEAGGTFSDMAGNTIDYRSKEPNKNGILATNKILHAQVLKAYQDSSPKPFQQKS